MSFWNKFCGIIGFFLIFSLSSFGQNSLESLSVENNILLKTKPFAFNNTKKLISFDNAFINFNNSSFLKKSKKNSDYFAFRITDAITIPGNFSICQYGFFCRQELKIEKATKIPLCIRVGSLEQCNYYEGIP